MARDFAELERSLIGSVLLTPEKMAAAVEAGVEADWFEDDGMSLLWSAMAGFWKRGEIDGATPASALQEARRLAAVESERRSAETLIADVVEKAIDSAGVGTLDITIRMLRNRMLERAAKTAIQTACKDFECYADATDVICALRTRLDEIAAGVISRKKISPRAVWDDILSEYREAYAMRVDPAGPRDLHWVPGLRMPWPKMTEMMNGLRAGLHVVAARPSVGKTAFVVNLMRFWCDTGTHVLFDSLDMAQREALRRWIAEKSRVSAFKAGFSPTAKDLAAMQSAVEQMGGWPLSVVEIRDVDELRTFCMIEKSAGRLGVVVVDYLQLLHAKALGREDSVEYARISYVSDTLKRMANELQVPVVALAQLNREVTKQEAAGRLPGLSDLRGSGSIEQDAFTVAILHRDEPCAAKWRSGLNCENVKRLIPGTLDNPSYRYNLTDLDPVWWILCKAQNGPTGMLPFVSRKKYFSWMLGDYEAKSLTVETGYGSTKRTQADNSPKFERVHSDWRHDPIERELKRQFALIESADDVAVDIEPQPEMAAEPQQTVLDAYVTADDQLDA